jgi:nucleoid-associated protein YgaU
MQKDFKIGLAVGLLFVVGVALWLSTRPQFSTRTRALRNAPSEAEGQAVSNEARPEKPVVREVEPERRFEVNTEKTVRIYVVQKGDTLSGISSKYYGSPNHWQKILAANGTSITDPNRLIPGARIVIPE